MLTTKIDILAETKGYLFSSDHVSFDHMPVMSDQMAPNPLYAFPPHRKDKIVKIIHPRTFAKDKKLNGNYVNERNVVSNFGLSTSPNNNEVRRAFRRRERSNLFSLSSPSQVSLADIYPNRNKAKYGNYILLVNEYDHIVLKLGIK